MKTLQERLEAKMIPEPNSGCWIWLGGLNTFPAGRMIENRPVIWFKGKHQLANRISYQVYKGKIPKKKLVLHTCDNSFCVNPDHLYAGTHIDNSRDMIYRRRNHWQKQTHCLHGHPFEGHNLMLYTRKTKLGNRTVRACRICHSIAVRKYNKKIKRKKNQ